MPSIKLSKCSIEADANTYVSCYKPINYNNNCLEVEIDDGYQEASGEYALSIGAATKESSKLPNSECTVSIHWEGNMAFSLGILPVKAIPFEVTASAVYFNNV